MNFMETQIYAELQWIHLPPLLLPPLLTAEKMKFSIMDFISKCDQFRRKQFAKVANNFQRCS